MSASKSFFGPKESIVNNAKEIETHFSKATTRVDRISLSFQNRIVQGNFGFVQRFRNTIPIINIVHSQLPPPKTKVSIQYHGMGSCWSFDSEIVSYGPNDHWMIAIPSRIIKNEARRANRFFLSVGQKWCFSSTQALGTFTLRDLSTMGCSLYVATNLKLRQNEHLRGMITFHKHLSVPVVLNVRHIHQDNQQQIVGCSFEEIADWGRIQIDEQLLQIPNSNLRRI
jgi:hypothetical protein